MKFVNEKVDAHLEKSIIITPIITPIPTVEKGKIRTSSPHLLSPQPLSKSFCYMKIST